MLIKLLWLSFVVFTIFSYRWIRFEVCRPGDVQLPHSLPEDDSSFEAYQRHQVFNETVKMEHVTGYFIYLQLEFLFLALLSCKHVSGGYLSMDTSNFFNVFSCICSVFGLFLFHISPQVAGKSIGKN